MEEHHKQDIIMTNMSKTLIIGNWKMHLDTHQASLYVHKLSQKIKPHRDVEVVLCPTFLSLQSLSLQIDRRQFKLGAQNSYWRDEGAYTGEVSATMMRGVVDYILVGHSERRHVFNETDKEIRAKVQAVLRNEITPVLCVGETATERTAGETKQVLQDQVAGGLANVTSDELSKVILAYEPVWAIGTGDSAKPDDVSRAFEIIRREVAELYGDKAAKDLKILYGGSVDKGNAANYLKDKDVSGLLIGGASLQADTFIDIVNVAHDIHKSNNPKEGKA